MHYALHFRCNEFFPRNGKSPVAAKNSGENGDTHGARSLFVRSFVVSENVSKVAYELSQFSVWSVCYTEMTKNSHSRGPHIFPYCRKFCKHGGKIMTKFELVADTCLLPLRIQQLLILLWIAVDPIRQQYPHRNTSLSRLIFSPTHYSLVWPYSQNFWSRKPFHFQTPHSFDKQS